MNKAERKIIQSNEDWSFFQIWVISDLEFDGKIYRNEKQYNNDSILTPENWEQHKETFFTQRMAIYKDSYTLSEKIKLEVSGLEKLRINKTDYEVLKERYKSHLEQKQALPTQQIETETKQPNFTNNFDNVTTVEIFEHFNAGLVEKQYLTEQELNEYLKAAFELKTIPETLFTIKDAPNKAAIEAVFYKYYKNVAGKVHGKQKQYAALLGDYFEGYKTTSVSTNFSKSVY
jgi:hypothetical protein